MIFRSHIQLIHCKVSNESQRCWSDWFNRLSDSMFASFPLAANAKPPSRTSRSFLYDCEPKSVVKQLTAFSVVHFHMKRAAALCSTVWPASLGTGLCQPFLRRHSLQPPPKTRRHWWKKRHLSHGPRGTGKRCFGGASGWQVPLVFFKGKRDGRMEEDGLRGPLFGFLSRRKLYCIPPFCYPSPSALLACWHFQLWGCSPASQAIVPLWSHSGV